MKKKKKKKKKKKRQLGHYRSTRHAKPQHRDFGDVNHIRFSVMWLAHGKSGFCRAPLVKKNIARKKGRKKKKKKKKSKKKKKKKKKPPGIILHEAL